MAPNLVWLRKMSPKVCRKTSEDHYFRGRTTKTVDKSCTTTFWASLGKFGQKSFAPQKAACSYTYGLTKFHAGSEQPLVCVVINNSSYPTVKNNHTAYHAFEKHWIQAKGFLNYRLKIFLVESYIYCICQPNDLKREVKKKNGGVQRVGQEKIWGAIAHTSPP